MVVEMIIILLVATVISLISALLNRFLIKQSDLKQVKNEIKFQKERSDKARKEGNTAAQAEASKEMMKLSGKQMRMSMKPLMVSMLFVVVILGWLSVGYSEAMINLPISMPSLSWAFPFIILTTQYNWFFWYILTSIPTALFFRKILNVE